MGLPGTPPETLVELDVTFGQIKASFGIPGLLFFCTALTNDTSPVALTGCIQGSFGGWASPFQ